jgi:hypothetical protein
MKTLASTLFASFLLSTIAVAAKPKQVNMPVGYTTTLSMPAPVSKVTVDDPSLVEVRKEGRKVVFVGRSKGLTEATVKTVDGEHHIRIFVVADRYGMP